MQQKIRVIYTGTKYRSQKRATEPVKQQPGKPLTLVRRQAAPEPVGPGVLALRAIEAAFQRFFKPR